MDSLMGNIEAIHIKNCSTRKSIGICKVCKMPYLINSPLKNSGCCNDICRHRFNARKSKAYNDLKKRRNMLTDEDYKKKRNALIIKYGPLKRKINLASNK